MPLQSQQIRMEEIGGCWLPSGELVNEKRCTKKDVRRYVTTAWARQIRRIIKENDFMFKRNQHVKYGGEILKIWLKIFNRVLGLETFPNAWKMA